jgi:hypothetical protein
MYVKDTVPTPNEILFYQQTEDYFNSIKLRSEYRARNIKDKEGASQNDDFALSEDEEDAFLILLKSAVYDVAKVALKMTKGVTDGIYYDKTISYEAAPIEILHANGFTIVDNAAYNDNTLGYVDTKAIECVNYNIMRGWYRLIGLDEEVVKFDGMYNIAKAELINGLFDLRKPLLT